jgi:predicted methyltransferase
MGEAPAMFRTILAGLAAAFALTGTAVAEDAALKAAVAGADRKAEHVARDGARHPAETLAFWGLKPGATVVEITPGGGYWSEILAPYAKATGGSYVAALPDLADPNTPEMYRKGRAAFEARFSDKAKYGEVKFASFGPKAGVLGAPGSADLVITARNVHNWFSTPGYAEKAFADFYAVLKPGGLLGIEEHRADPRPQVEGARDGYVAVSTVRALAEKAGFVFEQASEVNANPKDTKDHPAGVWTLPPSRRAPKDVQDFDRAKYDAIGESDRMTLRFRKPG